MSTTSMNGQRKTLATQLDRLDSILDGLAEALNEAVADAVRQSVAAAVGEAVQAAVKEVLTHPELLRAAAAQAAPAPAPVAEPAKKPSPLRRLLEGARRSCVQAKRKASQAAQWLCCKGSALGAGVAAPLRRAWRGTRAAVNWAWQSRQAVTVAAAVGVLTGLLGYAAGPVVASVLCGLSGLGLALGLQVTLPLLRLLGALDSATS